MAGIIEVKDQGKLRIYDADNSHYVDIVVPSSVTANRTITIPDASFTVPQVTNATHSGEVTGATALTIADNIVDEANLKVSNSAVNGYMLTAQSGNTGGLTWAAAPAGITMADNWRLSTDDATDAAETDLDTGWERVDATGHGTIGSAMTQSSGVFSFPVTGLYLIQFQLYQVASGGDSYGQGFIKHMDQANNTTKLANVVGTHFQNKWLSLYMSTLFDCQNLTNDRIQFFGGSGVNGQVIAGDTGMNRTSATFIRLGDT
tara:strand:- start:1287 stop:2066 length:780 start_codon:yes stop_codon:yes gene_type:complete